MVGLAPRALRNCAPSAPSGASVRPLNFTVRGTLVGALLKSETQHFVERLKTLRCRGADTPSGSTVNSVPIRRPSALRWRAAAKTLGISLGSFGERPSFGAGAARMRAVGLCQGNEVPSMDGNASPSNNCLERAVKLSSVAAGAGREFAPAAPIRRFWAAAQARR